jgi:SAM-dependent methyltransferase
MMPSIYCPSCRAPLAPPSDDTPLACAACGRTVPVREGIPLVGQAHDYYYAEIALDGMEWFLAEARAGRAATVFERPLREGPWDFLLGSHFDPTRAAWKLATRLPAAGFERVLDFGCGWGVNSLGLAPHAGEVVAMDLSWHRLLALKLLADAQGRRNVTVLCGGDLLPLPFPDDHFDCVALIGLIEWIPVGRGGDPRAQQLAFLKEVARVTRPGGETFLASENRYAYTYSRAQYRRLFREAGLPHTEFHGLIPAHRLYHKMFPLSRGRIVDPEETRGSALKDRLLGTHWAARLASAFGIRISDTPLTQSWVRRLCAHLRTRPGLSDLEVEPRRLITTNFCVKAVVRTARGDGVLVRIPVTETKQRLLTNAVAQQRRWRDHPQVSPLLSMPPADVTPFEGWSLTVEAFTSARPGRPEDGAPAWGRAAQLLRTFAETRGRGSARDALATRLTPAFMDHLGEAHRPALATLFASTRFAELPACYQHGDFHWENLLCDGGGLVRLVDWEWAHADGLPLADFFHLVINDGGIGFDTRVVPALTNAARGRYPREPLAAIAATLGTQHGLDADDVKLLALAWVYDVLRQQWEATDSYGLGARFLPAPIRRVADAVPALAGDLLGVTGAA